MRNILIAAALLAAATAQASQTDEAQMRHVLEMEGVGQVLPAAVAKPAVKPTPTLSSKAIEPSIGTVALKPARADVIAELDRARRAGELRAANEEIGDFALPTRNTEPVTRLGQWIKRAANR